MITMAYRDSHGITQSTKASPTASWTRSQMVSPSERFLGLCPLQYRCSKEGDISIMVVYYANVIV